MGGFGSPGPGHETLVVDGCHAAAGTMTASDVVDDDPSGDLEPGLSAGPEALPVDVL